MKWEATLLGQPRSKANNRQMALSRRTGKMFSRKNDKVLSWIEAVRAQAQAQAPKRLLEGDLSVSGTLYYPDRRSDLDPSALIDALQGIVFANDRQVKWWKDLRHGIDKGNPRAELVIEEIAS